MLEGLITSKTRVKLLMRFFLNPDRKAYLRELTTEFCVSSNGIREELRHLEHAHLLLSEKKGRRVLFQANQAHPLFPELRTMVRKALGIDQILESILNRLGHLEAAYLIDDYALGRDTGIVDVLLIGKIDPYHLSDLTKKTERYIGRKIRTLILSKEEFKELRPEILKRPHVRIWG